MDKRILWIAGAAVAVVAIGGASVAAAASNSPDATSTNSGTPAASNSVDDQPLTGSTLQQASDAAIARTGPGTVVAAETDDDASYEVTVQLNSGGTVEVELNGSFQVVEVENSEPGDD
jgi:hypothetical protein